MEQKLLKPSDLGDQLGVGLLDHFIVGQQGKYARIEVCEPGVRRK